MFLDFFLLLRREGLPVSLTEYLSLLQALEQGVGALRVDDFYALARTALVKHEKHLDRFDQLFGHYFQGLAYIPPPDPSAIPADWLRKELERHLSPEEMAQVEALGGLDELRKRFEELMQEQQERHQGGNRWIGTGGTSPFGAWGYNPAGFRLGQHQSRHRRALKVWDQRSFRDLRDDLELDNRALRVALKRLRLWSREGAEMELDLPETIRQTSRQGGLLDLQFWPQRHNRVKVLLLLDVGGSMDDHVYQVEQLFSAARHTFHHLQHYYFHNCLYEHVWPENHRRHNHQTPTWELFQRFGPEWRVVLVGDAAMSPYEITHPGGSVEHWNPEAGAVWLGRLKAHYPALVWLNPKPEDHWRWFQSTDILRNLLEDRMYPLTLAGLGRAMKLLQSPPPWAEIPEWARTAPPQAK